LVWYDTTYAVPAVRVMGEAKVAVCQPLGVSPEKVTRPRSVPVLVQRLPRCWPLFSTVL
jgi:hypothetical protein